MVRGVVGRAVVVCLNLSLSLSVYLPSNLPLTLSFNLSLFLPSDLRSNLSLNLPFSCR